MNIKASIKLSEYHSYLVDIGENKYVPSGEYENSPIDIHINIGVITLYNYL